MNFKQQYNKDLEKELTQFLFLCPKDDGKFLIEPASESNLDEKVRLVCIVTVLGYKKLLLKTVAQCIKFCDKFETRLNSVSGNFAKIDEWITKFTDNIDYPAAQDLIRKFWAEQRAKIDPENFHLRELLN